MQEYQENRDFINLDRLNNLELIKDHISEILVSELISKKLPDSHIIKLINILLEHILIMNFPRITYNLCVCLNYIF